MRTDLSLDDVRAADRDDDARWSLFQGAMATLRRRIHGNGASDLVLAELLEDDLRQARIALGEVSGFLDDAVEVLGSTTASAAAVVDASDPTRALQACEELESLLPALRRRLGQVALRYTRR